MHEANDTFLDGELVWRLARKGAMVIFDDYEWMPSLRTADTTQSEGSMPSSFSTKANTKGCPERESTK